MTLTLTHTSRPSVAAEDVLVAATRAGDDRAFEELYSRYQERISAFILGKVHDHGRAEDIAQDVFLSALRRLRSTDQRIAFKPWIYEIAKNACIDEFRRGTRSREVPLEKDGECVVDRHPTLSVVNTTAAAIESRQRLDDLRGAFDGLSPGHRRLLVMREFEGMSYDEIGAHLDMTRQMVESGLFRARRKLTDEYQELASGRRCEQVQTAIEAGTMVSAASLGLRQRRTFARHLAHCQPCRHVALMAGVDEALLKPRSIAAKIAALLPFPISRWPWFGGRGDGRGPKSPAGTGRLAAWTSRSRHVAASGPVQNAAGLAQPVTASFTVGPAAAAVAILALAGAGGSVATGLVGGGHTHSSVAIRQAAERGHLRAPQSGGGAGGTASRSSSAGGSASAGRSHASLAGTGGGAASAPASPAHNPASGAGSGAATGRSGAGSGTAGATASSSSATHTAAGSTAGAGAAGAVVKHAGSTASHTLSQTGQTVTQGVGKTVSSAGNTLGHTVSGVGNTVSNVGKTVSNLGGALPPGVGKTVSTVGNAVSNVGNTVSNVGKTVTSATSAPVSTVKSTVSGVASAAQGAASSATSPASHAVSGATSAASSATQSLGSVTKGLGSAAQSATSASSASSASSATSATSATQPLASATQSVKSTTQAVGSALSQTTSGLLSK
jgi:RNA polymerase sigma factor (sigma-70 family)